MRYTVNNIIPGTSLTEQGDNIIENNKSLLLFEDYKHDDEKTLEQFMKEFQDLNKKHATIYSTTKAFQTGAYSYRSLHDIFLIAKFYYPRATIVEVKDLLLSNEYVASNICDNISRKVYMPLESYIALPLSERHPNTQDEFGLTINELISIKQ